ncbi:hypothetical protein [Flagellimonas onchidii]|uniref:hypothetical protein n=1 Tax=Flagellimonas onchidii TaxID=2562684 RepID=UPI0010A5E213|nr:hypothetical protein [Allomuricauda onchidii]
MYLLRINRLVLLAALGLIVYSCQKEHNYVNEPIQDVTQGNKTESAIVLGPKLKNPYAISVMKKAFENITTPTEGAKTNGRYALRTVIDEVGDTLELVDIPEDVIRVTHKYVKFKPSSEEELDAIKADTTLVLFDHPLDYEIEQEGDYYRDPEVPDTIPTPRYATLKISQVLADTIPFEILSELYLPEEDAVIDPELLDDPENDQVVTVEESTASKSNPLTAKPWDRKGLKSFANKGKTKEKVLLLDALVTEAFRLTGNEMEQDDEDEAFYIGDGEASRLFGRRKKWTPEGTVQTHDNRLGKKIAPEGVVVKGWRWFTRRSAITNSSGYYRMGRVRKKYFKYRIVFERHHFQIKDVGTFAGDIIRWARGRSAAEIYMGKSQTKKSEPNPNKPTRTLFGRYL